MVLKLGLGLRARVRGWGWVLRLGAGRHVIRARCTLVASTG